MLPASSTPPGRDGYTNLILAEVAGPPSPESPQVPVPATVVITLSASTLRMVQSAASLMM